ncbi:antibiotic biosynthesis monooxygenase [Dellaglioa sp. P0083]
MGDVSLLNHINTALGAEYFLKSIIRNNPSRSFILLNPINKYNNSYLLDTSDDNSIFYSGLDFRVRYHVGMDSWQGFYHFKYITLSDEESKVYLAQVQTFINEQTKPTGIISFYTLQSLSKGYNYVFLTIWKQQSDFINWRKTSNYKQLKYYESEFQITPIDAVYSVNEMINIKD